MPTGIRPKVNEAKEFLEIAKDFKSPKEIIREALSNSWDANAEKVEISFTLAPIPGTRRKKTIVEIVDDGDGMDAEEIQSFFNLGDSNKVAGSIGTKGHGTKIYYKSAGITVHTWKDKKRLIAETEIPPWENLKAGIVPTYRYDIDAHDGRGTLIHLDGFEAKQKDFADIQSLYEYIQWYTIVGTFGHYFGIKRTLKTLIKPITLPTPFEIPFGIRFPDENLDLEAGTGTICKLFGPSTINCGTTEDGSAVELEIIAAILGEEQRSFIPHTYTMMGAWLGKDFIRVERFNELIEEVFGGQYYYRSLLLFANCQQFDLTANRNNIRSDQEEYDLALTNIKVFLKGIKEDPFTEQYFSGKKTEEIEKKKRQKEKDSEERRKKNYDTLKKRINAYHGRPDLNAPNIQSGPIKEPRNEAETVILLQSMISSGYPSIDFRIGEYSAYLSTDLLVEYDDKGLPAYAWVEVVYQLENLWKWPHPPEGIHKIVCWELGRVSKEYKFGDDKIAVLQRKSPGRYNMNIEADTIDIYVLRDLISL